LRQLNPKGCPGSGLIRRARSGESLGKRREEEKEGESEGEERGTKGAQRVTVQLAIGPRSVGKEKAE